MRDTKINVLIFMYLPMPNKAVKMSLRRYEVSIIDLILIVLFIIILVVVVLQN
jgi:hypothetical protein